MIKAANADRALAAFHKADVAIMLYICLLNDAKHINETSVCTKTEKNRQKKLA